MRLFLAIQLSPAVREALLTAQADLRRQGRGQTASTRLAPLFTLSPAALFLWR